MKRFAAVLACLIAAPGAGAQEFASRDHPLRVETVATGLEHPWSLVFLPDGRMLVSERPGRLRIVDSAGAVSAPVAGVEGVTARGQGGLLGLALAPDFASSGTIYYCHARSGAGGIGSAVARARLDLNGNRLDDVRVIFDQAPKAATGRHFGCRLAVDGAGSVFVTLGDRGLGDPAQDPRSQIGKVVRITPEGEPAPGNPQVDGWDPLLWSIGHHNVQGATLDGDGRLWTVEHGARGGDELNQPQAGRNYGWPVITYGIDYSGAPIGEGTAKPGLEQPVHYWDPSIAPSGLTLYGGDRFPAWRGDFLVGALAGQALVRLDMEGGRVAFEERLLQDLGERIRDVVEGPDGLVYLLTDAPDGRILRLSPAG